jgi:hypothetical protein
MEHEVAKRFFEGVVRRAKGMSLISKEHFTVDGTLIEAWASLKSFRRKDEKPQDRVPPDDPGNPTVDFHGENRSNETHESKTDPESRLARKGNGKEAKLCFSAHALMENRNGLCVDFRVADADGHAERVEALAMLRRLRRRAYDPKTVGGDKGYDKGSFPQDVLDLGIKPHIAINEKGGAADSPARRFVERAGYAISQRLRKRIEEIFGWMKAIGGFRRTRYRGRQRTQMAGYFVAAAYNLLRMSRLVDLAV